MSSTFKNRIPKRKYRERVQPQQRQNLGLLQKKQDYKVRSNNYHFKEDMLKKMKSKARMKNADEFYFKMIKGKKNQQGKHIEEDSDSDFDEAQYRLALKKENYSVIVNQRSILQNKIAKLNQQLQLISEQKQSKHKIFVQNKEQLNNFKTAQYFNTQQQFIQNNLLQVNAQAIKRQQINLNKGGGQLKQRYNRLGQYIKRQQILTKLLLKLGYQKNVLGKERKKIKKFKNKKIHKFFMQRKK